MARTTTLSLVLVALLGGGSFAAGCSGCDKPADNTADAAPVTSATPASSSATVAATDAGEPPDGGWKGDRDEPGRHGHRGGPSTMLFQAVRALELKPEQLAKVDAAEKLAAGGNDAAAKEAAKDAHAEVIAGIKAGKIDTAKLEPKYLAIEKLTVAEHDKEVESLNALYAAVDATQRKAAVASVRAKQAKREERAAAHGGKDGGGPDGGKAHGGRRSLDRLVRGIDLDAEQQKKVDALAPKEEPKGFDPAEMKKRMDSLLTAFEKDGFDAKKADGFDVKKNRVALEEETKLLGQLLPILKPEQREKLAAKMDRGSSPRGPKRSGFGHRPLTEPDEDDFAP